MIPSSKDFNWIIGPVGQAIGFVAEETKITGTLHRGLIVLKGQEVFLRLARERFQAAGAADALAGVDQLLASAPILSQWATELQQGDFSMINKHSLIAIWGAVEVAVEDTVVLVLSKEPTALAKVSSTGIDTSKFAPGPVSEDDARRLFARLERKLRENLKVGDAYIKLLGLFDISFSCSGHTLSKLEEINSVRNCLLHRGGIIDDRAAQSVGALRPFLGQQIPITQARYLEYYDAVGTFLSAMMNGVIASPHIRTEPTGGSNAI
jgi:hypothetical protein